MKNLIIIALIGFSVGCFGQNTIVYVDGDSSTGKFWGYSEGVVTITINGTNQPFSNVDSVMISKYKKGFKWLYANMSDSGIKLLFGNRVYSSITSSDVAGKLRRFQKQRNTAFIIQGVSFLVAVVGGYFVAPVVAIIGGVGVLVGWGVNWNAGKQLE